MAKVITGDIADLTVSWENYAGESVEKFIKQELGASCGYIYRTSQKEGDYYYLYGFHSIDDFNEWMAGEPITPLFRVQLPNVENDVFAANLYTNSNTTKIVNLGDGVKVNLRYTSTSTNPTTHETSDTYNDGTLIIMRSANGSAFSEVARLTISPIEYTHTTSYQEVDLTEYLLDGDNEIRMRVIDNVNGSVSNNVNFKSIVNTTLRVSNATPITNPMTSPLFQFYVEGQIAKTLNIEITQDGNTDQYAIPMGTATWIEAPYYAQLDGSYETGIINVEAWLSVDDTVLESNHIFNEFYYVNQPSNVDAIILNNISPTAVSYTNTHFFDFVVFNAVSDVNIEVKEGNTTLLQYTFENCSVNTLYSFYNSIQIDSQSDYINATMIVSSANDTQTYPFVIDNREKMSPTAGADFVINPLRRSNSESNPNTIINDVTGNAVTATFTNFNFTNDGWVNGDNGIKVLRIPAGSSLSVAYDPFVNLTRGTTIELDYKVYNVFDDDDVMIKMSSETFDHKPLGFIMNATEAAFYTAENQTKRDQDVMFQENTRTHMVINIIPNLANSGLNYIRIFINGVMNREMIYSGSDIFKNGDVSMIFGSNHCDIDIFSIRVYKSGLSASDVRQDYMSSIPSLEDKLIFKNANDILSAGGTISYDKACVKYNTLVWTGNHPEYRTGDQEYRGTLQVNILDDPAHSGVMTNLRIKGQGSSSKGYWKWNHQYDWNKYDQDTVWTDGNGTTHTNGYTLTDDDPAAVKLVAKLNWASSMQSHKIGSTALYTDLWKEIVGGNSITNTQGYEDARVSVHEKPFLYFIKEDATSVPVFAGLMTFGSGKFDKLTFGYDKNRFPDYLIIEGSDNGMPLTNRQIPWFEDEVTYNEDEEYYEYAGQGNWDYGMGKQSMLSYFIAANNFVYLHSLRLAPYSSASDLVNPSYQYWNTSTYDVVRYDHISGTWVNAGATKTNGQYSVLNIVDQTGVTPTGTTATDNEAFKVWRKNDFKAHIAEYYNITDVLFSMALLKMIAASDNRCKNTYEYLDPVTHKICLAQDDMDTIMLTDNVGRKTKPYYVEEHDINSEGGYYFNGEDNNFFTLMDEAYNVELRAMMKNILNEMSSSKYGGSVESCLDRYFFSVQEYFPAVAYNETARLLYEEASVYQAAGTYTNGTKAISQSLGDQLQGERQWWTRRLKYLQSWAGADPFYVRSTTGASLNFRSLLTTLGTNPTYQFDLTPWQWLYPKVGTGQVPGQDNTRVQAGNTYTTNTLTTDGNTDTFIYGADYYTSYGEFGDKPIGEAFPLVGQRLLEFSADSREVSTYEFRPRSMTVSCPVLKYLCLYGCSTVAGVLNLSSSTKLESVDLRGTGLQTVVLPETDTLTEVYLPALTSLTVNNCPNISTFSLASYGNLVSINTDNSTLALDVMENASNLHNLTLNNINITTTSSNAEDIYAILADPDITCNITGSIYLDMELTSAQKAALTEKFGLSVFASNSAFYISFDSTPITTVTLTPSAETIGSDETITIAVSFDGNDDAGFSWNVQSDNDLTLTRTEKLLTIESGTITTAENVTVTYTLTKADLTTITQTVNLMIMPYSFYVNGTSIGEYEFTMLYGAGDSSVTYTDGWAITCNDPNKSFSISSATLSNGNVVYSGNNITSITKSSLAASGTNSYDLDVNISVDSLTVPYKFTIKTTKVTLDIDNISTLIATHGEGSVNATFTVSPSTYTSNITITSASVNSGDGTYTVSNVSASGCTISVTGNTASVSNKLLTVVYKINNGSTTSVSQTFDVTYLNPGAAIEATYEFNGDSGTYQNFNMFTSNSSFAGWPVDGNNVPVEQISCSVYFPSSGNTYNLRWSGASNQPRTKWYGYHDNSFGDITIRINGDSPKTVSVTIPNKYFGATDVAGQTVSCKINLTLAGQDNMSNLAYAWNGVTKLKSIKISNLAAFGGNVFEDCTNLSSVTLPNNLTSIWSRVFDGCSSLTSLTLPASLTYIHSYAFDGCAVTDLTCLATTAPSISSYAFSGIAQGGWLTYPNNSDYSSWLTGGTYLTGWNTTAANDIHPTLWFDITDLGRSDLNKVYVGQKYDQTTYQPLPQGDVVIPDTITYRGKVYPVTGIGSDEAYWDGFYHNNYITSVTFGNNMKSIEMNAFSGCTNLETLTIGSGVEYIGGGAVIGCIKVNTISINKSVAPEVDEGGWSSWGDGTDTAGYSSGTTNVLYVPQNATGYNTQGWTEFLLNPSYGKFTVSKTL
jgi:hypothetical protein